jgi:hypothetical protein
MAVETTVKTPNTMAITSLSLRRMPPVTPGHWRASVLLLVTGSAACTYVSKELLRVDTRVFVLKLGKRRYIFSYGR